MVEGPFRRIRDSPNHVPNLEKSIGSVSILIIADGHIQTRPIHPENVQHSTMASSLGKARDLSFAGLPGCIARKTIRARKGYL